MEKNHQMEVTNRDIRGILKFFFVQGKSAKHTHAEIIDVLGVGTVSLRTVQEWFRRFKAGNFDTDFHPAGGRPVATNVELILEKVAGDRKITLKQMSAELNIPTSTIGRHLKASGYKFKKDLKNKK